MRVLKYVHSGETTNKIISVVHVSVKAQDEWPLRSTVDELNLELLGHRRTNSLVARDSNKICFFCQYLVVL